MSAVDTNVLLRLLLADEPRQAAIALAWVRSQPDASVLVTDAVLVEVLFLLESKRAYGLKRQVFLPEVLRLLSGTLWRVLPLTWQALDRFAASKLDYVDCMLWALREAGVVDTVATFDRGLATKAGGSPLYS